LLNLTYYWSFATHFLSSAHSMWFNIWKQLNYSVQSWPLRLVIGIQYNIIIQAQPINPQKMQQSPRIQRRQVTVAHFSRNVNMITTNCSPAYCTCVPDKRPPSSLSLSPCLSSLSLPNLPIGPFSSDFPITIVHKYPVYRMPSGQDSLAPTAIRYGLDGTWIKSRQGRDFPHPSRPSLGPTQSLIQGVPGHCQGKVAGVRR
jgi:hypothetical protein